MPVAAATGIGAGLSGGAIPYLNHQFVMIKTKKWLYVVAKGKGGCECFRAPHNLKNHLLDTQKQYDKGTRAMQEDPAPKVWKGDKGIFIQLDQIFNEIVSLIHLFHDSSKKVWVHVTYISVSFFDLLI